MACSDFQLRISTGQRPDAFLPKECRTGRDQQVAGDTMPGPIAVADVDKMATLMFSSVAGCYGALSAGECVLAFFGIGRGLDRAESALSNPLGIVNGAVFSDLDTDGFPELIVATEWGRFECSRISKGALMR